MIAMLPPPFSLPSLHATQATWVEIAKNIWKAVEVHIVSQAKDGKSVRSPAAAKEMRRYRMIGQAEPTMRHQKKGCHTVRGIVSVRLQCKVY